MKNLKSLINASRMAIMGRMALSLMVKFHWQGWKVSNRTFEDEYDCEIEEIRQILDDENYVVR